MASSNWIIFAFSLRDFSAAAPEGGAAFVVAAMVGAAVVDAAVVGVATGGATLLAAQSSCAEAFVLSVATAVAGALEAAPGLPFATRAAYSSGVISPSARSADSCCSRADAAGAGVSHGAHASLAGDLADNDFGEGGPCQDSGSLGDVHDCCGRCGRCGGCDCCDFSGRCCLPSSLPAWLGRRRTISASSLAERLTGAVLES